MKVELDLGNLGIIEGDAKGILEYYIGTEPFIQRKSYDEYYVRPDGILMIDLDISDLMILAEAFIVRVYWDGVALEGKSF